VNHQPEGTGVCISDCEGPISKNDNAFELAKHFIPDGDYFFSLISKYDDVLADVIRRPKYKAGYTLKLITPFLKAYGATNETIERYSAENMLLIQGAKKMLNYIRKLMPSFIISTSYNQYISSLCSLTDFPPENVYCTRLDLDKHTISEQEVKHLKKLREEIAAYPMIEIPEEAKSLKHLSRKDQKTVRQLDEIFWKELPKMASGKILQDVNPIGGEEKAKTVMKITKKVGVRLNNVVYIGDSITDVHAFCLVKEGGGLTISFNGNRYAVQNAEIAVLSENAIVTSMLVNLFFRFGTEHIMELTQVWSPISLERFSVDEELIQEINKLNPDFSPKVEKITSENMERLVKESSFFRKTVRGKAIGGLG
jgi:energy-converting hydrogenase A subunit R